VMSRDITQRHDLTVPKLSYRYKPLVFELRRIREAHLFHPIALS
jgi:hypothetical protein